MIGPDPGPDRLERDAGLGDRPWHVARMESRWWLWKGSGDGAHLAEAKRLLDHLVAHAPEECRGPMLERVPLHRDIAAASGS